MDIFLIFITVVACLAAGARIAVLLIRLKHREKERAEDEAASRVTFHEAIDDLSVADEIKKSCALIFGAIIFPAAMLEVWYCSYAGPFSKTMGLLSVVALIVFTVKEIENRQA